VKGCIIYLHWVFVGMECIIRHLCTFSGTPVLRPENVLTEA
jgi:hypothetical protein